MFVPLHLYHSRIALFFSCFSLHSSSKMPIFSSSGNLTFSLKVGLVSTCVLSVAIVLKFSVPLMSDFVASDIPVVWNALLQWLKPPYLYLVINCIIISIVASSKLQQKDPPAAAAAALPDKIVLSGDVRGVGYGDVRDLGVAGVYGRKEEEEEGEEEEEKKKNVGDRDQTAVEDAGEVGIESAVAVVPQRSDSMELLERFFEKERAREREKPPVSSRFGQRKAMKASPEGGKALKVSKSRRHDTLESTWKTITEGRPMPLTRHLKKSDTWETHVRHNTPPPPPPPKFMKKSETFNDPTTTTSTEGRLRREPSGRLKKEPSLSQDELNRRVEAFINKFNEEMRLQRQRSLDQYNEMISRGAN